MWQEEGCNRVVWRERDCSSQGPEPLCSAGTEDTAYYIPDTGGGGGAVGADRGGGASGDGGGADHTGESHHGNTRGGTK
jgi:hypothetical protein